MHLNEATLECILTLGTKALIVTFSVKLLSVRLSRANTLQTGKHFILGVLIGSGCSQSSVQPQNYSFWLNRVVSYLNKVRQLQNRADTKGWEKGAYLGDQGAGMKREPNASALSNVHLPAHSEYPFFQVSISITKFLIILRWLALLQTYYK